MRQTLMLDEDELSLLYIGEINGNTTSWFSGPIPYVLITDFSVDGRIERFTFKPYEDELHKEQAAKPINDNMFFGMSRDQRIIYDLNFIEPISPYMISIQEVAKQIEDYASTIDDSMQGNMNRRLNALLLARILNNWRGRINTPRENEQ